MVGRETNEDLSNSSLYKKRIAAIGILLAVIALFVVTGLKVYVPILRLADDPEEFRLYLETKGFWGTALFILITAAQVIIAVIPGGPVEVLSGYCFGSFKGALIADLGMTIGSTVVFLMVRRFGMAVIELFFSKEKIASLKFLKTNGQSRLVIFLLFLIPGTPKDILSYGVGLTDLTLPMWILITSVGRFPSILFSTMSGDALMEGRYGLFAAILIILVALAGAGTILYRRWQKKQ